jgi:3-oxoacyl-[acyl-carrier-protein] synthase III
VTQFGVPARRDAAHSTEIVALAHAYPTDLVDNEEYIRRCRFVPTTGWDELAVSSRMKTRRWCRDEENTLSMARAALDKLRAENPGAVDEIDVVLVASGTTMPMAHPTDPRNRSFADLAPLLLQSLGKNDALGLDIKACYCTGFLRGLQVVDGLLTNPNYRAALLVAVEQGSRFATAESNRTSFCYIVGDAAGAVILRRGVKRDVGLIDYCGYTDVEKLDWVGIGEDAQSIIMWGSRAATAAHDLLVKCGSTLLARNGLRPNDVKWFLPIQTHAALVDGVASMLEFSREQVLWFGDVNGFSGSASIPSCLSEQTARGVVRPGDLVLSVAAGAGINCAAALYRV